MPTEDYLKKRAKQYFFYKFKGKGKIWFPVKTRWGQEKDIFGIFDGIFWIDDCFIFFQITTYQNKTARLKKIVDFMLENYLYFDREKVKGWLMAWHSGKKEFLITEI